MIVHIRRKHQLLDRKQRLRQTGLLTITEMAEHLGVHPNTIKDWHHTGIITGQRINDKGECLYQKPAGELDRPKTGRPPGQRNNPARKTNANTTRSAV